MVNREMSLRVIKSDLMRNTLPCIYGSVLMMKKTVGMLNCLLKPRHHLALSNKKIEDILKRNTFSLHYAKWAERAAQLPVGSFPPRICRVSRRDVSH